MEEHQEFREFVHTRGHSLTRSAYLLTGDHHLAEDLLQNVLGKVARRWHRITSRGHPESYVRSALYREYVSWRRLRRNAELPIEALPDQPADDISDRITLRISLERALARLTQRQRAVLMLRFYEDLSEKETAATLGCSVGTVKSQTNHALVRLRALAPELADLLMEPSLMSVSDREGAR